MHSGYWVLQREEGSLASLFFLSTLDASEARRMWCRTENLYHQILHSHVERPSRPLEESKLSPVFRLVMSHQGIDTAHHENAIPTPCSVRKNAPSKIRKFLSVTTCRSHSFKRHTNLLLLPEILFLIKPRVMIRISNFRGIVSRSNIIPRRVFMTVETFIGRRASPYL